MNAMNRTGITGVVLAGGQGRRMGGVDKGLQLLRGRPMTQWIIERLAPQVDELLLNANRNLETYATFGYPVIADRIPDHAGPLAGLHAALSVARHPLVVTAPCDSPFLPTNLVARLYDALLDKEAEIAVARTAARRHPVFCLCRKDLLPSLASFLAGGGRKVGIWHQSLRTADVFFDNEAAFDNINTPDDLTQTS